MTAFGASHDLNVLPSLHWSHVQRPALRRDRRATRPHHSFLLQTHTHRSPHGAIRIGSPRSDLRAQHTQPDPTRGVSLTGRDLATTSPQRVAARERDPASYPSFNGRSCIWRHATAASGLLFAHKRPVGRGAAGKGKGREVVVAPASSIALESVPGGRDLKGRVADVSSYWN
jgi:hypothetical protein